MTQEASKLNLKLKYIAQKIPQEIILDLVDIKNSDINNIKPRASYKLLFIGSITLLVISVFLSSTLPGVIMLILTMFSSSLFYYLSQKYARLKVDPYRYLLAKKLASLLQRDMPEQSLLKINLDLTKTMMPAKLVREEDHPSRSRWKLKIYQDPWLNLEGKFSDRTNFSLKIIEHHRNASGYKTSRSGKRKYKSKNKFKGSEVLLRLYFPIKKYGAVQILKGDALEAIKLPNHAQLKDFKLSSKSILLKVNLTPILSDPTTSKGNHQFDKAFAELDQEQRIDKTYEAIIAMFLSLYQILNLARTLSKARN